MNIGSFSAGSIALLLMISTAMSQTTLKASINMAGITGYVSFFQPQPGQTINVNFDLTGVSSAVQVEIRQSWVDYTVNLKCADDVIGTSYNPSTEWTINTGNEAISIPASVVNDVKQIMGRSLLITKGAEKACGTLIMDTEDYHTAMVRLQSTGVIGEVWFRQADGQRTEILADLFDPSASATAAYQWKLYTGNNADCRTLSTLFNPTSKDGSSCSTGNQGECPIGDMEGKHSNISVGQTIGSIRKFYHDTNLPVYGTNTIVGTHLVILDRSNFVVSCGLVTQVKEKVANAVFNKDGAIGQFKFQQKSPFDITEIFINWANLGKNGGGVYINEFPVPSQIEADDQLCSVDSIGNTWNPFNKPLSTTGATSDLFAVGDISGKFDILRGQDSLFSTHKDVNLPMFGPNSIVGRSVGIQRHQTSNRWICANIEVVEARTAAIATFRSSVIATIIFSQIHDDPTADTWVYGELNYADGVSQSSNMHMWMIHENKVSETATRDYCSTVGGMFNPFNVYKGSQYASQCKASNPLRCQVGDGTRQTSSLTIRKNNKVQKFFYTVKNMPLSGPGSIIGRSLVIHDKSMGTAVLACSNIYHLRTREAIVDSWTTDVKGYFRFSQHYSIISSPTHVSINVSDMNSIAGPYHVHVFPLPPNADNPCSGASVAGHYNPFNVVAADSPPPGKGTYEKYESGDLSGKNGYFTNMTSYNGGYTDNMLFLFGLRSVVGRSIVIHKDSDGSRWSCGNLREDESMTGGMMLQAQANFSDSPVRGHVVLTQYVYPDGAMSDTSVFVYLNNTGGKSKTNDHKISIGTTPAWGDRTSGTDRCGSTGEVYNPFNVNTEAGYSECGAHTPLRCAAGDLSRKLGTYNVGGGKMLTTDVNLPLTGKYSVIGRSLVVGEANGGSGRLACSNIRPVEYEKTYIAINKPSSKSLMDVAKVYTSALNIHRWELAVFGDDTKGSCGDFDVYFMGQNARDNKRRFETMVTNSDSALGAYTPTTCAGDKCVSSLFLLGVIFIFRKVLL